LETNLENFVDEVSEHVKNEIGEYTKEWEGDTLKLVNHKGYKFTPKVVYIDSHKYGRYKKLDLIPEYGVFPDAPAMVEQIAIHFFDKVQTQMDKFSEKTGWKAETVIFISNKEGESYVVTRDSGGNVQILPQEQFLLPEEE